MSLTDRLIKETVLRCRFGGVAGEAVLHRGGRVEADTSYDLVRPAQLRLVLHLVLLLSVSTSLPWSLAISCHSA